ncbi:MAG: hyaluronidase [Deltaproteobacteria bacterium]|nr:hyaluronidase [Deltaproteobacteria bacterium]
MESEQSLGVIEGFFGQEWSWQEREQMLSFMAEIGYDYYLYAPKADRYLRRDWQSSWPDETSTALQQLISSCQAKGLRFGLGLSPYELYLNYHGESKQRLFEKIDALNELKLDILCVLFDDMKGDIPGLATYQAEIVHDIAARSNASSLVMCPSYYSFDPVLEKVFGEMPENYFSDLGEALDPTIEIFWTGPKVCSTTYPTEHLQEVTSLLKRKPFIWDNYPVNDGARMSRFLHLKAFEGRPHNMRQWTSGHTVNPMNQPWLSMIPMATLIRCYEQRADYDPSTAYEWACLKVCGEPLGRLLIEDVEAFHEKGLDGLDEAEKERLKERYRPHQEHGCAKEIIAWLNEEYTFDPACLTD